METQVNFRNLLLARESRGYTQKQMSEEIKGLNQGNLSKMEKGLLPIQYETLTQIAEYLDYPINFFHKASQNRTVNSFFYRKRVTISSKDISMLEAQFDITRMAIDELLESVDIPECSLPCIPLTANLSASDVARRIRLFLGLQRGPIDNFISHIENQGVIIAMLNYVPEKFFGVTMFTNRMQPVIFLNNDLSNDAKRFTIGHELGHLVMHLRDLDYSEDDIQLDKEANEFSSEFNMPTSECRNDLINLKYSDLPNVKMYWKLSKAAISYRAKSMGFLTDSQYKYFMMQLSSSHQRKKEVEVVDLDRPKLLKKIIDVHLNELNYTKEELANITGLSTYDLNDLFFSQYNAVKPKMRILRKPA